MSEKQHSTEALAAIMKSLEDDSGGGMKVSAGSPFAVRVDGVGFSKFTRAFDKPYDPRLMDAMLYATEIIVAEFQPVLTYAQSDEVTFLFSGDVEPPMAGRVVKLASRLAAQMTSAFVLKLSGVCPELVFHENPHFDGRVTAFPDRITAAKNIQWRETDARKNAVSSAASTVYPERQLSGKNTWQRLMMLKTVGTDFGGYPEVFRSGVFLRRVKEMREMTEKELRGIPSKYRPTGPIERTVIKRFQLPELSRIENLTDVIFDGVDPVLSGEKRSDF